MYVNVLSIYKCDIPKGKCSVGNHPLGTTGDGDLSPSLCRLGF